MGMQTVFIEKGDGKKRNIITQQYVSGLYVAIYKEGSAIPIQLASKQKETAFHRRLRKKIPDYIKEDSTKIPDKTVVIFRKFKDGAVIALFPEIQADRCCSSCQSYLHVGQHGAANYDLVNKSKLASPKEYEDLKKELESIGYDLTIRKRINKRWYEVTQ